MAWLKLARKLLVEVMVDGEWDHDPKSDEHRVQRQQVFIQRAMADTHAAFLRSSESSLGHLTALLGGPRAIDGAPVSASR